MLLVGLIRIAESCSDLAKGVVIRVRIILLVIPGCLFGSCSKFVCIGGISIDQSMLAIGR